MITRALALSLFVYPSLLVAQSKSVPASATRPSHDPAMPITRLAPSAEREPGGPFARRLIIDPLEQTEGNAALVWSRAGTSARSARFKWTDKEFKWDNPGAEGTPLDKLPLKEVRAVLEKHAEALRLADEAARRKRCDWEFPAPTLQNLSYAMPLDEIQRCRELARLIKLRCRLELAERRFDDAQRSLQTGLAMSRQLADGSQLLIQDLVALAVANIMISLIHEWQEIPNSPNLYWALTEIPTPFIDTSRSMRSELSTIYRSFPKLNDLKKKKLSEEQASVLIGELLNSVQKITNEPGSILAKPMSALGVAGLTFQTYPAAKKSLLNRGWDLKQIEAMPEVQVVAIHLLEEYDRGRDDLLQCLILPAWQGLSRLEKVEARYRRQQGQSLGQSLLVLLMPAISKVYAAQLRTDRWLAGLRGAEALRMYAADNKGMPPARWQDISVPDPIDPFTGTGIGSWYRVEGGKGILVVPPPPSQGSSVGRHYELSSSEKSRP